MNPRTRKRRFLLFIAVALAVLVAALTKPLIHLFYTASRDADELEVPPPGYVDDASRLNQTKVAEVWQVPVDTDDPEGQIAQLLARARAEGRRVSIAGARHSMGGHSIYPGGGIAGKGWISGSLVRQALWTRLSYSPVL